ncbi:hypothetical protein CEXT_618201 [Caerostris extrusa]|uniref:Uncharacterized protein n=1 Tax=Caerostris extrusa TaxID=172846 RepID=A0AAV4MJH0_CAEEX|nr:hypothetical protein CEXT_618201 [Caerostris extrusa]
MCQSSTAPTGRMGEPTCIAATGKVEQPWLKAAYQHPSHNEIRNMETFSFTGCCHLKVQISKTARKGEMVVLVSHDEQLIEMVCQELWVCRNGSVTSISGGFSQYRKIVEDELAAQV